MTTALLRSTTATDPYRFDSGRGVVTRSNGVVYAVSYQSDSKIHIYEISSDRSTVNDRILITPSSSETPSHLTIAFNPVDSSIAVAYQLTTNQDNTIIRWCKVNTTTWTASGWENVAGSAGINNYYWAFDMDVSDTGMTVIALLKISTSFSNKVITSEVWCRNTGSGAWNQTSTITHSSSFLNVNAATSGCDISVICLGVSSGVRDIVYSPIWLTTAGGGQGAEIRTLRAVESSGAISGANSARVNMMLSTQTGDVNINKSRHVRLFRNGTNGYAFGGMSIQSRTLHFHKGTFSAGTWTNVITEKTFVWSNKSWSRMAMSFGYAPGENGLTYIVLDTGGIPWVKVNYTSSGAWVGGEGRYYSGDSLVTQLSDASVPYPSVTESDILLAVKEGNNNKLYNANNLLPTGLAGITQLRPADSVINQPASPQLSGLLDTGLKYGTGVYEVEFQFAVDSSFTTSLVGYRQPVSKGIYVNGTDTPGVTVAFTDTLVGSLSNGIWYYRARITDMWGNVAAWTATQSFAVGHPPTAVPTSPTGGGFFAWSGGKPTYTWAFTDPSGGDFQTAYQVKILDSSGATVLDTGKVISAQKTFTPGTALSGTLKDTHMSWQVKLWDSQDTAGLFSDLQAFVLTDPPSVIITSPIAFEEIGTGVPVYTFAGTTGGGRRIKGYSILVTSGGDIVYSGPQIAVDVASGVSIDARQPPNYLQNQGLYTVQISVIDSGGLVGVSAFTQFSVDIIPPASVTGVLSDASFYDLEDAGYCLVTWNDSAVASGFTRWSVYRRADLIDEVGTVLETGEWVKIADDFDVNVGTYAYKDFLAPANYLIVYAVTQWINNDGQDIESEKTTTTPVITASEAYWLINTDEAANTATTFRMSIVTDDSFTEEQEEAEFTVIGRGRLVNRGQYLGPKGSLGVRLRSTGLLTARQKRLKLLQIQKEIGEMQLRNPFGDVWTVNMSNMAVSRLAGVGVAEFCDVTIPYSEVS